MTYRSITQIYTPSYVLEGAGVKLKRSMPTQALDYLDPFLLLDHFGSDNPQDYLAGFPMHPHRGIETVTYMLEGKVNHKDSLGNAGTIGAGDVQWMTAGGGIMHEEMPKPVEERMEGFQLWVNLPAKLKMTRPRYQEILSAAISRVQLPNGAEIRIIAGKVGDVAGPVSEIYADPTYLDVHLPQECSIELPTERNHTAFAYVYRGMLKFGAPDKRAPVDSPRLVVFGEGEAVFASTETEPARLLFVSGAPLHESVARYGPFVMNTRQEIEQALRDLRNGTFVWQEN